MWQLKLRQVREQRGYSIKKLSEESGVPVGTISGSENSHTSPTLDTVNKLAKVLGKEILEWRD